MTNRERQRELERIKARYQDEYYAGRSPRIEDYVRRYPRFARELREFAFYFHTIAADLPEPQPRPAELSPAAQAALARIRQERAAPAPAPAPHIEGLFAAALAAGLAPPKLADAVGLSLDILGKLEARAIAATTVPATLLRRLAEALRVTPEAVAAYLGGSAGTAPAGAFYYADKPPVQQQEPFLHAVQTSPSLSAERKREWTEIAQRETAP
jgi:hypothetical protein